MAGKKSIRVGQGPEERFSWVEPTGGPGGLTKKIIIYFEK